MANTEIALEIKAKKQENEKKELLKEKEYWTKEIDKELLKEKEYYTKLGLTSGTID